VIVEFPRRVLDPLTRELGALLSTRDTAEIETPARAATSLRVDTAPV
jgi:hypothetical protein